MGTLTPLLRLERTHQTTDPRFVFVLLANQNDSVTAAREGLFSTPPPPGLHICRMTAAPLPLPSVAAWIHADMSLRTWHGDRISSSSGRVGTMEQRRLWVTSSDDDEDDGDDGDPLLSSCK